MACQCENPEESREEYLAPLRNVLADYEMKKKNLIPILQAVQGEYDYLPQQILREVSESLGVSISRIYGVATFYSQFHLEPRGENIIRVCMGTACHVRGGEDILEEIQDELGIDDGETTEDLEFTLESVACIGACGLAPVIMINDDTHGRLEPDMISGILDEYR